MKKPRKRLRSLFIVVQIVALSAYSVITFADSFPIQKTGFEFENVTSFRYEGGQTTCYAYPNGDFLLEPPINLQSIGFSKKEVNSDIHCMAGDFDNNGYLDFLVWKGEFGSKDQDYKAIFYGRINPQKSKKFTSKETFNYEDKIFQHLKYKQNTIETARNVTNSDRFLYWKKSYDYGKHRLVHAVRNTSTIRIGSKRTAGHGICKTKENKPYTAEEIGIDKAMMSNGVRCVVEDLDGNGFFDIVLWSPFDRDAFWVAKSESERYSLEPDFKIFFFNGAEVIGTQLITKHGYDHIDIYGPTEEKGTFGEPKTKLPGLIQYGEGGNTTIYLYNPITKKMESSFYASEWD